MDLNRYELVIFDADGTLRECTVEDQFYPLAHGEWVLCFWSRDAETLTYKFISALSFNKLRDLVDRVNIAHRNTFHRGMT